MSNKLYYITLLICFFLCSEKIIGDSKIKEWQKINCSGIENIDCDHLWDVQDNSVCYILANTKNPQEYNIYFKFTPAKLEREYFGGWQGSYHKPIRQGIYQYCLGSDTNIRSIEKQDLRDSSSITYQFPQEQASGLLFIMDDDFYFLSPDNLYKLKFDDAKGGITFTETYALQNKYKENTPILGYNKTVYYISDDNHFCSINISNSSSPVQKSILSVSSPKALATDKQNKVYILDSTDGVIEYDTTTQKNTQIAKFPVTTRNNLTTIFFYIDGICYYVGNNVVYALIINASSPKKIKKSWSTPKEPTIEGGNNIAGESKFFETLDKSYLSTKCDDITKMFEFDSKECAFNLTDKLPQVETSDFNNTFSDDQYLYIYNPDRNTMTRTDTKTGMTSLIACYENMPQDIIRMESKDNSLYILTESGNNHIARIEGNNLKYVSSWKLDDWTPRTDVSMVTVNNEIYVFGGKEESSNTCLNELYVFDSKTNSSEKLEMSKNVTPRSGATLLANEDFGKLYITGGQDSSDSTVLDMWEVNTKLTTSGKADLTYLNNLPDPAKDGNNALTYDKQNDILSLLITPKKDNFSAYSETSNTLRASSGVVVYQMTNLAKPTDAPEQSGKSCGCLGLEFLLALAGLFILRRFYNA